MPRYKPHTEETKKRIAAGQHRPDVKAKKAKALSKYWKDVRSGKKPMPRRTGRPPRPITERFWSKVDKKGVDDCWLFTSNHGGTQYGMLSVPKGQEYFAHRISWIIHNGSIPDGLLVLHTCDVPKCVNPKHLFLGTNQDNMDDMVKKGRSLKGVKHPSSRLTDTQVKEIRRLHHMGNSQTVLARLYGVSQTLISAIVRRKKWTHI